MAGEWIGAGREGNDLEIERLGSSAHLLFLPHHGLLLTAFIAVLAAPPHDLYRRPDLIRQTVPLAPQMVGHGGSVGAADLASLAPHAAAPLDDLVCLPVDQDLDPLRRIARASCYCAIAASVRRRIRRRLGRSASGQLCPVLFPFEVLVQVGLAGRAHLADCTAPFPGTRVL